MSFLLIASVCFGSTNIPEDKGNGELDSSVWSKKTRMGILLLLSLVLAAAFPACFSSNPSSLLSETANGQTNLLTS